MIFKLKKKNRVGDHICYITNIKKFRKHYPKWNLRYDLNDIINQIINSIRS